MEALKITRDADNVLSRRIIDVVAQMSFHIMGSCNTFSERYLAEQAREERLRRLICGGLRKWTRSRADRTWENPYCVIDVMLDGYRSIILNFPEICRKDMAVLIHRSAVQLLQSERCEIVPVFSPEECYLFLYAREPVEKADFQRHISELVKKLRDSYKRLMDIDVIMGLSSVATDRRGLQSAYLEARYNAKLRFVFGTSQVFYPSFRQRFEPVPLEDYLPAFNQFFELARGDLIQNKVDELFYCMCGYGREEQVKVVLSVVYYVAEWLSIAGYSMNDILKKKQNFYERIHSNGNALDLRHWIVYLLNQIANYWMDKKDGGKLWTVERAIKYIYENLDDSSLSLKALSEYSSLSEKYFSNIFKKYTGECFINFITNARIKRAKELLCNSDIKIYEICEKSGYQNVEHFSRVFKKVTGESPRAFRRSQKLRTVE